MRVLLFVALLMGGSMGIVSAQVVTTSPALPNPSQPVTITVNVEGTTLKNHAWDNTTAPVWAWMWIAEGCANTICDAPTNVDPATSPAQDAAKATRISTNPTVYQITITPTTFFNKPASELKVIGIKLKTANWTGGLQTDNNRFITLSSEFNIALAQPLTSNFFVRNNDELPITANTNEPSVITVKIGSTTIASSAGNVTTFTYNHRVTETSGSVQVDVTADNGTTSKTQSFTYTVSSASVVQARPPGIIDGINYSADQTKVTLSLWAPGKTSVYAFGDFSNWDIHSNYKMKRDGEHFWIEISGLTPGTEYGFQYLVDEKLKVADPYSDKILDPDDRFIPANTYPNLKAYPAKALNSEWYFNRVSVFQTAQQPYTWVVPNFQKPAKEKLVVYELLVRDFFGDGQRNYNNLIDTIGYLKRLGINAIHLMPTTEFNGNESWGYNPAFMFAPDKYYGTKNKFKEFIDVCHQNGIAVIMDAVLNHQDLPNSYLLMDFDFTALPAPGKPNPTNKWFNVSDRHPYGVFYDMNHESDYTKAFLDTVTNYWMKEYKIDGYRFDLSKGFTQNNKCGGSTSDEGCFQRYDAIRIANLKRMADRMWDYSPDAYVILEHFAENSEEKELAEYRSNEGKGMMFWGNLNSAYAQNSMGFSSGSDIGWVHYGTRGWTVPHVMGYMESQDEERMMYRNITFGNSSGSYNARLLNTALERTKTASAFFYTVPGPKMLWQFGELGYEVSLEFNGRTGNKPVRWEYQNDEKRVKLFKTQKSLIALRDYDVFQTSDVTLLGGSNLVKQITLKNSPYVAAPASAEDMNVVIVGNFDVVQRTASTAFPHTGTWYHYYGLGYELPVNAAAVNIVLQPGEFRLYTDVKLPDPEPELMSYLPPRAPSLTAVTFADRSVTVNWLDLSSLETEYKIYRRKAGDTAYELAGTASQNATSFTDKGPLLSVTPYEYYVEAGNVFGLVKSNTRTVTTDIITGVEDEILSGITVYPNPSSGQVYIKNEKSVSGLQISVYDIQGKRMSPVSMSEDVINISNFKPGIYIIKATVTSGVRYFKVIKD